jgi:hypothetical protein
MFSLVDRVVVMVDEAGGKPGTQEPFSVHFDRDHPQRSSVLVRRPAAAGSLRAAARS